MSDTHHLKENKEGIGELVLETPTSIFFGGLFDELLTCPSVPLLIPSSTSSCGVVFFHAREAQLTRSTQDPLLVEVADRHELSSIFSIPLNLKGLFGLFAFRRRPLSLAGLTGIN